MRKFFNKIKGHERDQDASNSYQPGGGDAHHSVQQPISLPAGRPLLQAPTSVDILRYRYHHGVNFGSVFVLEKWLWPTLYEDGAKGDSELDAAQFQVSKYGIHDAQRHFESFWDGQTKSKDWDWLWDWLKNTAQVTSIRLPIGYFTLGPQFCHGTPFEKVAEIYTNAWAHVKETVRIAGSHGIGVLLDFHALPGGANGDIHSGTSSHKADLWGNKANLAKARECLVHIAQECAHCPELRDNVVGLQLCNEAVYNASGMFEFYDSVISAIHTKNPDLPIYISDAWNLGSALNYVNSTNTKNTNPVIVDTHKYYCFSDDDKKCAPQQVIDKVDIPEVPQGESGSLVVGEYSCVMDGSTWSKTNDNARPGNVVQFGNKQSQVWQSKTGGCFFWTCRMAWFPGGEWGFKEQVDKNAITVPPHAADAPETIKATVDHAQAALANLKAIAVDNHVSYWNNAAKGEQMEHFRFEDGYGMGYNDALAFFEHRSKSQGSSHRAGADRIGLVELWSARRFAEYQADQLIKDPNVQQKYFWEWQHGFKEGIKGFNTAING